jgi:thioesterase domain-containing protein/acyl carrier protein
MLMPIWERVLQRSEVGVDDSFFDLGGDSSTAVDLFGQIAQVCGQELPPETILQTPTIAGLAGLLEGTYSPRMRPLIRMRSDTEWPPVFITHGLGGNILELSQLLRHIQTDHPVYGLQAKGIDGMEEPHCRIEDMAQYFLDAVREVQQHGPYILIGYSLGGLVMFDMARRLSEAGEKICLLALIESFPDRRFQPMSQRIRIYFRLLKKHLSNLWQLPLRNAIPSIFRPSVQIDPILQDDAETPSERRLLQFAHGTQNARAAGYRALAHFRPRFYPGKIKFVKAEISLDFPDDANAVWSGLAAEVDVETVPGDHHGVVAAHSEILGSVLSRYLHEAVCQK